MKTHPTEYCHPLKELIDIDNYDGPDNMADIEDDHEYKEYRHRAQAGQTTEDDAEIYGHGEDEE